MITVPLSKKSVVINYCIISYFNINHKNDNIWSIIHDVFIFTNIRVFILEIKPSQFEVGHFF